MPFYKVVVKSEVPQADASKIINDGSSGPLNRISMLYMADLVRQLSEISEYTANMMEELDGLASKVQNRVARLGSRTQAVASRLSSVQEQCNESLSTFQWEESNPWVASNRQDSALFTRSSLNKNTQNMFDRIPAPPNLAIFDEYKDPDKPPCAQLFSDPNFFFNRWTQIQEERDAERRLKKKHKKKKRKEDVGTQRRKVREVKVKRYNNMGELIVEEDGQIDELHMQPESMPAKPVYMPPPPPANALKPASAPPPAPGGPPASAPPPIPGVARPPSHGPPPPPGQPQSAPLPPVGMPPPPPPSSALKTPTGIPPPPPSSLPPPPPPQLQCPSTDMPLPPPANSGDDGNNDDDYSYDDSAAPLPPPLMDGAMPPPPPSISSMGSAPPPPPSLPIILPNAAPAAPPAPPMPQENILPPPPIPSSGGLGAALSQMIKADANQTEPVSLARGQDLLTAIREGKKLKQISKPVEQSATTKRAQSVSNATGGVAAILARRMAMEESDSDDDDDDDYDEGEWSD
jgi:hypothetical protein